MPGLRLAKRPGSRYTNANPRMTRGETLNGEAEDRHTGFPPAIEQEVPMMFQKSMCEAGSPASVFSGNRGGMVRGARQVSQVVPARRKRSVVQGGMFNHNRRAYRSI